MLKLKNILFFDDIGFEKLMKIIINLEILDLSYTKISNTSVT